MADKKAVYGNQGEAYVQNACVQADAIGLPIFTIISLLIQYGPAIWRVLTQVIPLIKAHDWEGLVALLQSQGAAVYAIAVEVAKALGITLPPIVVDAKPV